MNYRVAIEEVCCKEFNVEADTAEEAMDLAIRMYKYGDVVVDGDATVTRRQLCVAEPGDEMTEWVSF